MYVLKKKKGASVFGISHAKHGPLLRDQEWHFRMAAVRAEDFCM